MNRNTLPENRGMLFIYQKPGHHRHWMYRCFLPLDIVWLDGARRIVEIRSDAPAAPKQISVYLSNVRNNEGRQIRA